MQPLLSLHVIVAPAWHEPAAHTSPLVHASPSLQTTALLAKTQPVSVLHESFVHELLSLQVTGAPETQVPPLHASPLVHALLSEQPRLLLALTHPVPLLQLSVVQASPSSQLRLAPGWHAPPRQTSPVVQALPSEQVVELLACAQPLSVLHESSVQTLLSSQSTPAPDWHEPPLQVSPLVQALPSSQDEALLTCVQPLAGLHESSVQALVSSQSTPAPDWHDPPLQVSVLVHASPSVQVAVLLLWVQPAPASQPSSVQTLPSLQLVPAPGWQLPPEQTSLVVHASPSSQPRVLLVWSQPVAEMHESVVHAFESLQPTALPD